MPTKDKPESNQVGKKQVILLLIWSALAVLLQLGSIRMFSTFNSAFGYYGNVLLLVGIFSTSIGFFAKTAHKFAWLIPLSVLGMYATGLYLHGFNLVQAIRLEFQWTSVANIRPKEGNMDLQVASFLAFVTIALTCFLTGAKQKRALIHTGLGPVGYILLGVGGILGGILFLLQNQFLSGHISLLLLIGTMLAFGLAGSLSKIWQYLLSIAPILCVLYLAYGFSQDRVWSPYHRIDIVDKGKGSIWVFSNDMFILTSFTKSADDISEKTRQNFAATTQAVKQGDNVLVIGSGTGTRDVREALRQGAASVTAVEIDPVFPLIGNLSDPDQTYKNPKVNLVTNDARRYLTKSKASYDIILGNYLDSQTNSSNQARFRLDSFLYTKEGFQSMLRRLSDDGILVINFASGTPWITLRLFETLQAAAGDLVVKLYRYPGTGIQRVFVVSKSDTNPNPFADLLQDITPSSETRKANQIGIATDDWPFLYSLRREIPQEHLRLIIIVGLLFAAMYFAVTRHQVGPATDEASKPLLAYSFFSGAAFFFFELRAISLLTPIFGSTYVAQATVISLIISLSVLGSLIALKRKIPVTATWIFLGISALISLFANQLFNPFTEGLVPSTALFSAATVCPIFAAGLVFMCYIRELKHPESIAAAQRWNLIGGVLGGMLEVIVIITGFQASITVGILFYAFGFIAIVLWSRLLHGKCYHGKEANAAETTPRSN